MRLRDDDAWQRAKAATHGVLGTLHPERGPDLVPAVYAAPVFFHYVTNFAP